MKTHSQPLNWHPKLLVCLIVSLFAGSSLFPSRADVRTAGSPRRVNVPYFPNSLDWAQTAIFWFGEDELGLPGSNYADVRAAYTPEALNIRITIVDYYLWYNPSPTAADDLTQYEAAVIYLDKDHDGGAAPQTGDYWFLIGARHWEDVANYVRQAQGDGSSWDTTWVPTTEWSAQSYMSWNCNPGPNSNVCGRDFGWTAIYTIPWETLGLSGPPQDGTLWGLGVQLHDRDDQPPAGYVAPEHWPETFDSNSPTTWGELHFGYAVYQPAPTITESTTMIRASTPMDNTVEDAWMGGGGTCGGGQFGGGDDNHGDDESLFVGTETASTHFPCFNKSFLRFYLDAIPPGKAIISATLTLHHWGNAGENLDPGPQPSWVHLFTISDPWDEMTIHWNNAPLAQENVAATWIYPVTSFPGHPGIPYHWNATQAVAEAYANGDPVSVAIYSSDTAQHSSRYLTSSETGINDDPSYWNWNAEARPTLRVAWGSPVGTVEKSALPSIASPGEAITYTLDVVGGGQELTLTDELPDGVSPPIYKSPELIYTPHRLTWTGTPDPGERVTLTYVVTVTASTGTALWNQAELTQAGNPVDTAAALVTVGDLVRVYLPLMHSDNLK